MNKSKKFGLPKARLIVFALLLALPLVNAAKTKAQENYAPNQESSRYGGYPWQSGNYWSGYNPTNYWGYRPWQPWWYYRYFPQYPQYPQYPHYPQYPDQQYRQAEVRILSQQPVTQSVRFSLRNTGNQVINLTNSAPWKIVRANSYGGGQQTVFTPIAAQVITPLQPSESKDWSWDLKDNDGHRVQSGYYRVVFDNPQASAQFYVQ